MPTEISPQIIYDKSLARSRHLIKVNPTIASNILLGIGFQSQEIPQLKIIIYHDPFDLSGGTVANSKNHHSEMRLNLTQLHHKNSKLTFIHEAQHLYDTIHEPAIVAKHIKNERAFVAAGVIIGAAIGIIRNYASLSNPETICALPGYGIFSGMEAYLVHYLFFSEAEQRAKATAKLLTVQHPEYSDVISINPQ